MEDLFRFRRFSVHNSASALKIGTDAVLLGAAMTVRASDRNCLDAGTGTGVIALMAAQRLWDEKAGFRIDAIEVDGPSADEAALSFRESPWSDRLSCYHARLQDFTPEVKYDLIFSNPPYYDNSLTCPDDRATAARHSGSMSYRDIFVFASDHLSKDGRISLILPSESEKMLVRAGASFGFHLFRIIRISTTERKPAKRIIAEFSRTSRDADEERLVLQDGERRTDGYAALTKDFYL